MKLLKAGFKTTALLMASVLSLNAAQAGFDQFITVKGDQLMEGEKPFRFVSWNIPNLLIVEDSMALTAPNDWRIPDAFELTDALASVDQLGGRVVRTYSITVLRADEDSTVPKHVLGINKFNEEMFRSFDLALKTANEQHIRLIIPLVNHWIWQGGREEYAAWRGKSKDAFFNDPQLLADFEQTVKFVLTRTNTLTGIRYLDDKSILCWETGNEVRSTNAGWTRKIAAFIKSIDTNHLVMDGYDGNIRPEVLAMPEVDIVTTHHYPSMGTHKSFGEQIRDNAALTKGKKPYIIGEFGFVKTPEMEGALQAILDTQISGGMLWSLRFRNRDGGFYWHSEPDGAGLYKAFHWPGWPTGDPYDERRLLQSVRTAAFKISGLEPTAIPVPKAPVLLPIKDIAAINWQGSVGAVAYSVQRANSVEGPWTTVADNVDETLTQYKAVFADETAQPGTYYYRVLAKNDAGVSEPSNLVGPVVAKHGVVVDELADFTKSQEHSGVWSVRNNDTRKSREDIHRAAGAAGSAMVYKLPAKISAYRVMVFFPKGEFVPIISTSEDGVKYQPTTVSREAYFNGAGDYGYWKAAAYHAENLAGGKFLKIELTGETQLSRIEINYLP